MKAPISTQKFHRVTYNHVIVFLYFEQSGLVAVGTHKGLVQIWDAGAQKRVSTIEGHTARVGKRSEWSSVLSMACHKILIIRPGLKFVQKAFLWDYFWGGKYFCSCGRIIRASFAF